MEERKKDALKKVAHWDEIEAQRPLTLIESKEKVVALKAFKFGSLAKETLWRKNQEKFGLKKGIELQGGFTEWKTLMRKGTMLES